MALHNVSKDDITRSNPSVNTHDLRGIDTPRMAHQTLSTVYQTDATPTPNTRVVFKHNLILFYDDQNRIIRVDGFIPSLANYPVSIQAKYGYDVYVDILGISAPGT